MKEQLTIISDDLNHGIITEKEAQAKLLILFGVSVSLPDTDELFKLAHDYAYKRCSLQNFDSEAEIELVKIRYVHGYEQALKDFVNGDYDPDQLCNER